MIGDTWNVVETNTYSGRLHYGMSDETPQVMLSMRRHV